MIGSTLGRYEILGPLGAGGMGEVYRARDPSLGREVALKVLSPALAGDGEHLARFEREARLLAAVDHPNIGVLYGLEEAEGVRFLSLELVPGESLADRLRRGPLPVAEALRVARQVAAALERAHERGVLHRDLKPSNVLLTPRGEVKVVDFGIAKRLGRFGGVAGAGDGGESGAGSDDPSTAAFEGTVRGAFLGTVAYASPEQLRGERVDARTDVWAFGCLLYELLAGRRAFAGATPADLFAAVLEHEPDWEALPPLPPAVRRLLHRCLRKEAHERLHAIADARIELDEAGAGATSPYTVPAPAAGAAGAAGATVHRPVRVRRLRLRLSWFAAAAGAGAVAALLVGAALSWLDRREAGPAGGGGGTRFAVALPAGLALYHERESPPSLAFAPAGDELVLAAAGADGRALFRRRLDRFELEPVAGTARGASPFYSPDGRWLGFFADGQLKKVPVTGGTSVALAEAPRGWGGAWGDDGTILFNSVLTGGLWAVPAEGGEARRMSRVDPAAGEQDHVFPHFLPGGEAALFTVWTGGGFHDARIALLSLGDGSHRTLIEGGCDGRYDPVGRRIVFARGGRLMAAPFDLERLRVTDVPAEVLDEDLGTTRLGTATFALAADGSLAWAPGAAASPDDRLVAVSPGGEAVPVSADRRPFLRPRLSPGGDRVAFHAMTEHDFEVWTLELARGVYNRLTTDPSWDAFPVWSPDGAQVVFASAREGAFNLFVVPSSGGGAPRRLLEPGPPRWPTSWSPDGTLLAYFEQSSGTGHDLWLLPVAPGPDGARAAGAPRPWLAGRFDETRAVFSPGGALLAYESTESGAREVYVAPVAGDGAGGRTRVSTAGGQWPMWGADDRTLHFLADGRLVRVRLGGGDGRLEPSMPEPLLDDPTLLVSDRFPDGRFLAVEESPLAPLTEVRVALGWSRGTK